MQGDFFQRTSCSHSFLQELYRADNFWQQVIIKDSYFFERPALAIRFFKDSLFVSPL